MIVLKVLGFLLVFGGSALVGKYEASRCEKSYRELCGATELVRHIKNEIQLSGKTLDRVFASFSDEALEKCGFSGVLNDTRICVSCRERWERASGSLSFAQRPLSAFRQLGATLGTLPPDMETQSLERVLSLLEDECAQSRKALERDKRVIYSVSSMAGLAIAIILL